MSQSDIIELLSRRREWFCVVDVSKELNVRRTSIARNVKSLYKFRDFYGLDFRLEKKNKYYFRKK